MSDSLPFDVQVEILKRLPVKSLIRNRSVSETWKSVISSSAFISGYSGQQQHLFVRYAYDDVVVDYKKKYVSIVDDKAFPQLRVSLTEPLLVKYSTFVGSSHGLFCFYGSGGLVSSSRTHVAVLWNPLIRKAVAVVVPNVSNKTVIGFGVCRETTDPKIVKITYSETMRDVENISCIPWQVEVFTMSTGVWRTLYSNLPNKLIYFDRFQVVVDGVLFWLAKVMTMMDGNLWSNYNLIISFDMTSEKFEEVNLPDSLASRPGFSMSIFRLRESLVVLEGKNVWKMEDGVPKSFAKRFTINTSSYTLVIGFRMTGEALIELVGYDDERALASYEPHSKLINCLWNRVERWSSFRYYYMESLLLLDQPDFKIYNCKSSVHDLVRLFRTGI